MEMLLIVLNHEEHFRRLVQIFDEKGIHGGTILDSQGLATSVYQHISSNHLSSFRSLLNNGRPYNKTIFLVLDEDKLELAKACVREAAEDLERENVGIMFTLPVSSVEGITK
ncbi:MAG: hypothetical protein Q4E37_05440 [Tissierellia bacterium]|nr:hypothetical protein [Tissierellia bacterium]